MTEIKLTNTATRSKQRFEPLDPSNVRMYVCGPTVYDRAHLGNARPVVVFDTLYRLLRHVYGAGQVTYVRNITDVDDKINARAAETGRDIREITDETIGWYHDDMGALGVLPPDHEPRATEYIPQMIAMIETLIDKGCAYEAQGHVLFSVESYDAYGALSGRSVDDMIAGARVEVAPYKRNPMDFVLWKPSDETTPGWDSPWGRGRPGWHIECSAMSRELLGERFDIHGGGIDLQFPHHENEIAQSRCACGEGSFAQVWMHNEMIQVEGRKMSKSLGNFFTVRDLLEQGVPGEVIRFVLLSTHYRSPMDWTERKAEEAQAILTRWAALAAERSAANRKSNLLNGGVDMVFIEALADDLNSPKAIKRLHDLNAQAKSPTNEGNEALGALVHCLREFFGIDLETFHEKVRPRTAADLADRAASGETYDRAVGPMIETLIEARREARAAKDFARADAIRDGFAAAGVEVKDTPEGTTWSLKPGFDPAKLEALQ